MDSGRRIHYGSGRSTFRYPQSARNFGLQKSAQVNQLQCVVGCQKKRSLTSLLLHTPWQNFVCRKLMAAFPTDPTSGDLAASSRPGVERVVMSATALATLDSPFVFLHILAHARFLRCSSSRETRFRRGGASIGWCTPPSATPCIEAATAQPTRQSSQWLSGRNGLRRHSRTSRPWPWVSAEVSEPATCSANNAWLLRLVPYSVSAPQSPGLVANRAWTNDFQ